MDLSAERWQGATHAEREALARQLAGELPSGFAFEGVRSFRLGEQLRPVALYRKDSARFALIPGTTVSLGYNADRPWEPSPEELESWQDTSEEYGITRTIREHIAEVTLRVRHVALPPALIETAAVELGREPISFDDPEVQDILREHGQGAQVELSGDDVRTRVRHGRKGEMIAERALARTHADLARELLGAGFRFPTSDEWEHACGGGATTLFRWGDHAPAGFYPTDVTARERARYRASNSSADERGPSPGGFTPDWDDHRQPNAFGLSIASDPYRSELVAETGVTRGGDGGSMICGGAGFFVGWLTLATAYFEEHCCTHDPAEPMALGFTVGRRLLELR